MLIFFKDMAYKQTVQIRYIKLSMGFSKHTGPQRTTVKGGENGRKSRKQNYSSHWTKYSKAEEQYDSRQLCQHYFYWVGCDNTMTT